jgi:signal transduction histidine kinase
VASLLDNAIKFSPPGSTVNLSWEAQTEHLIFETRDRGSGIPREYQERVVEPFAKTASVERFEDTGLGLSLYLDKLILDDLGGVLTIDSKEGQGTRVTARLVRAIEN